MLVDHLAPRTRYPEAGESEDASPSGPSHPTSGGVNGRGYGRCASSHQDLAARRNATPVAQEFRTPWVAGLVLGVIPPIFLIPYLLNTEATTAIRYVISADGLLYLAMYFIIALACVWYYRRLLRTSPANVLVSGVLPLIGGVAMLAVFIYGLTTQRPQVSIVAGTLVVACVVVAVAVSMASRAPYFVQQREVHEVDAEVQNA